MRFQMVGRIAEKELALFFSSPIGYLFLLAYLGVTLFVFSGAKHSLPATSPMCGPCSSGCRYC